MSVRAFGALALVALPFSACYCTGDEVNRVAPQIFVDVCGKPQRVVNGKNIGGYDECTVDFGNSDISIRVEKAITITNPSSIPLSFVRDDGELGFRFEGDPAFEFAQDPPTQILPGLSAQVVVRVRPVVESTIDSALVIVSDANNTPPNGDGNSEVRIPLRITGVDNGVPQIHVEPAQCDYGTVAIDGVKVCNVEISNTGTRELYFDEIDFTDVDAANPGVPFDVPTGNVLPPFAITGSRPNADQALGPNDAPLSLRVTFAPDVEGNYRGRIHILSSDPSSPVVEVPLAGIGAQGPTCVARIKSVGGQLVGAEPPAIEPLDDVILTLEDSTATAGLTITGYEWTLQEVGPGSTAVLSNPQQVDTGFLFANRRGLDVAGRYVVSARVIDSLGTASVNDCHVVVEAIPQDSLLVQLSWATSTGDMDLHVTKLDAQNRYCVNSLGSGSGSVGAPAQDCNSGFGGSTLDCGYYNCNPSDTGVEWDGVTGRTVTDGGDPSLDIDDTSGFGPENINVDRAVPGSYLFGVSYFSGSVATPTTMRLFLFGQLSGEWNDIIEDEFWSVAIVQWPSEQNRLPCIEDVANDNDPDDDCTCVRPNGDGTCGCWEDLADGNPNDDCG